MDISWNSLLLLLAILVVAGRVLSQLLGKSPAHLIDSGKVSAAAQANNGLWWFMLPILLLFTTVYNLLVYAFWFIQESFNRIASWLAWIYHEVIVSGLFFLLGILWHYLVVCPWSVLRDGFIAMGPAFRRKSYLTAVTGLSVALFLSFLGRYIASLVTSPEQQDLLHRAIVYFFYVLAILPVGIACTVIASKKENESGTATPGIGMNYLTNALTLLIGLPLLLALQGLLLWIGGQSDFHFVLTTLLAGGNMIGAVLILFNSALILFILLALPSFTLGYSGNSWGLYSAFFKYLHRKWLRYALVVPAAILPALLLMALPYFITSGIGQIVKVSTKSLLSTMIDAQENTVSSYPLPDLKQWNDPKTMDKSSIEKAFVSDISRQEDIIRLEQLNYMNDYLVRAYHGHAHRNGTLPFLGLIWLFNEYDSLQSAKNLHPLTPTTLKNDEAKKNKAEAIANFQGIEASIISSQNTIQALERELEQVCAPYEPGSPEEPSRERDESITSESETDYCEIRRSEIREQINKEKNNLNALNERLQRADVILSHFNRINGLISDKFDLHNNTLMIGYIVLGIWFSILLGFAFAMGLSLFAHLCYSIHRSDDDSEWMLVRASRDLSARNPQQPFLGVALLLVSLSVISYSNPFGLDKGIQKTYTSFGNWTRSASEQALSILNVFRTSFSKRSPMPILDLILPADSTGAKEKPVSQDDNTMNPIDKFPQAPTLNSVTAIDNTDVLNFEVSTDSTTDSTDQLSHPIMMDMPDAAPSGSEGFPDVPIEEPGTWPDEEPQTPADPGDGIERK